MFEVQFHLFLSLRGGPASRVKEWTSAEQPLPAGSALATWVIPRSLLCSHVLQCSCLKHSPSLLSTLEVTDWLLGFSSFSFCYFARTPWQTKYKACRLRQRKTSSSSPPSCSKPLNKSHQGFLRREVAEGFFVQTEAWRTPTKSLRWSHELVT